RSTTPPAGGASPAAASGPRPSGARPDERKAAELAAHHSPLTPHLTMRSHPSDRPTVFNPRRLLVILSVGALAIGGAPAADPAPPMRTWTCARRRSPAWRSG